MNYLDYFIFVIVAIGFILGAKDGFVRKIIGVVGLILAIFISFYFAGTLGAVVNQHLIDDIYLSEIVAGLGIFIISIIIVSVLKRVIHPLDKVNKFVNQILGGIAGSVQMLFFLGILFFVTNIFSFPSNSDRTESLLYRGVYRLIPSTISFIFGEDFKAKEYFEEKIERHNLEEDILDSDSLEE